MTDRQKRIALLSFLICLAMFLLPPTGEPTEYGRLGYYRWEPIWEISDDRTIDFFRLLVQFGFILVPAWFIGFYARRD